jgi:hypothetical protein
MSTADGHVIGTTRILDNGPAARRFNLVILAEGYRAGEMAQFAAHAQAFVSRLLATRPFDSFRLAINVYRVDVASTDSGADDPAACGGTGATARTFFDATFCGSGIARLLVVNAATALGTATAQVPETHQALVLVNHARYGGSGGAVAVSSLHADAAEIAIHEIGHSAFGLSDEYCGAEAIPATEPGAVNVTINTNPATLKWRDLVGAGRRSPPRRGRRATRARRARWRRGRWGPSRGPTARRAGSTAPSSTAGCTSWPTRPGPGRSPST